MLTSDYANILPEQVCSGHQLRIFLTYTLNMITGLMVMAEK